MGLGGTARMLKLACHQATECPSRDGARDEERESAESRKNRRSPIQEPHGEEAPVDEDGAWKDGEDRAEEARHIRPKEERLRHVSEDVQKEQPEEATVGVQPNRSSSERCADRYEQEHGEHEPDGNRGPSGGVGADAAIFAARRPLWPSESSMARCSMSHPGIVTSSSPSWMTKTKGRSQNSRRGMGSFCSDIWLIVLARVRLADPG